jgi:hypothetical protein
MYASLLKVTASGWETLSFFKAGEPDVLRHPNGLQLQLSQKGSTFVFCRVGTQP